MGVSKKSLHTWQRRACSTGPSGENGVCSQSDGSETSNELSIKIISPRRMDSINRAFVGCMRVAASLGTEGAQEI